jgi:hypothetical protein
MTENPFDVLRKEMKPLGARLETGVVTEVTSPTVSVDIAGSVVTEVPVAGSLPAVNDKVWLIRQGTTVVVIASSGGGGKSYAGLSGGQWHPYESGKYYPGWRSNQPFTTTISAPNGGMVPHLALISNTVTISDIVSPNGASESENLKWAIYDSDAGGYPSKLLDSGEETGVITESMDLPLTADLTLDSGVYWIMFKWDGTGAGLRMNSTFDTNFDYQSQWLLYITDTGYATGTQAAEAAISYSFASRYWVDTYASAWPDPFVAPGTWTAIHSSYALGPPVFKVA